VHAVLRVVSWNVLADAYIRREYYPNTPPEVFTRARRRKAVAERIASMASAEVICLQEADSALFTLLEEMLPDTTRRLFRKRGRGEGCAIFVRQALTTDPEWRELVFSDLSGHVALGVTFAGVTIVTTHLKWHGDGAFAADHCGRRQLSEILDAWPSGRRIICGDFNATPDSCVMDLARSRGLLDAHATFANTYTCVTNGERKRIDFILHTPDFDASPSPLPSIGDETPMPSNLEPSDHLPLEARLQA
jgi:endonuclease/exonuclease/phosphatase family metal-dependent hydrolase